MAFLNLFSLAVTVLVLSLASNTDFTSVLWLAFRELFGLR